MPVKTKKVGARTRIVEAGTGKIAKGRGGKPLDGGGYASRAKAVAKVQAVNLSMRRAAGKPAPPAPRRKGKK